MNRACLAISSSQGTQVSEVQNWRKLARSNAIEVPIEIGNKCWDLRRMKRRRPRKNCTRSVKMTYLRRARDCAKSPRANARCKVTEPLPGLRQRGRALEPPHVVHQDRLPQHALTNSSARTSAPIA